MNRVREWRRLRNLTVEELALRSRTTASQISKLERGQRRLTVEWMERLSKALGCRTQDLLPPDGASSGRNVGGPLDRELLRRMGRALMKHLRAEGVELSPPRFLETAIALHDLIAARPPADAGPEELPPELKSVVHLFSTD